MPQTKSHIKNYKIILRNRSRNKKYKLAIKKAIKQYISSTKNLANHNDNLGKCQFELSLVYKTIDKAVKRKILHKNTASRKKSRLAKVLKKTD
uniref:Small ribosomal subunit protein bS20c n=1 Tax=Herposiphonia versicolor TaxID=2007163 RepID=A0A1Z1MG82_9FLOR|nr:ribosomal protein S20 [Herposiphonia versicolor]ARW64771.1 ribosomal protein S20 [Herposiphonia versicolor]